MPSRGSLTYLKYLHLIATALTPTVNANNNNINNNNDKLISKLNYDDVKVSCH